MIHRLSWRQFKWWMDGSGNLNHHWLASAFRSVGAAVSLYGLIAAVYWVIFIHSTRVPEFHSLRWWVLLICIAACSLLSYALAGLVDWLEVIRVERDFAQHRVEKLEQMYEASTLLLAKRFYLDVLRASLEQSSEAVFPRMIVEEYCLEQSQLESHRDSFGDFLTALNQVLAPAGFAASGGIDLRGDSGQPILIVRKWQRQSRD